MATRRGSFVRYRSAIEIRQHGASTPAAALRVRSISSIRIKSRSAARRCFPDIVALPVVPILTLILAPGFIAPAPKNQSACEKAGMNWDATASAPKVKCNAAVA